MTKGQATTEAKRTLGLLKNPKAWRISVWDNIGWHYCLEHKASDARLTVWPGYNLERNFSAMLSLSCPRAGDPRWHNNFHSENPNKAVEHVVRRARLRVKQDVAVFESVLSTLKL